MKVAFHLVQPIMIYLLEIIPQRDHKPVI